MNKKILMVIAHEEYQDEEYNIPRQIFENAGFEVKVASSVKRECRGKFGGTAKSDMTLEEVEISGFDAIVFIGGHGAMEYSENHLAHKIAREFYNSGKITAAICRAPDILANAGILENKKATSFPKYHNVLKEKGAIVKKEELVVQDGLIITACGPEAAEKFGHKIVDALSK